MTAASFHLNALLEILKNRCIPSRRGRWLVMWTWDDDDE